MAIAAVGWMLIISGVTVLFAAITVFFRVLLRREARGLRGGGLVLLGLIPIIFGTDEEPVKIIIALAIALIAIMLILVLFMAFSPLILKWGLKG